MIELTIERKARAYDEAKARMSRAYNSNRCTIGFMNEIFPELIEESEDEKIRKSIIAIINNYVDNSNTFKPKMIAWIEKQKTSEEAIQYLKENHSPSEVSDFQTAMNIAVAKAYDKGVKDGLENRGQTFTKKEVDDAYLAGVRDAKQELEKQGEPVEINPTEFDTRLQSLIGEFESLPKEELIGSLSFWLNVVQNDGTYREEKQDAQKSIDYNEELKKCRENPLYFFDKYVKVKLKEQNPTWSEEDEYIIERLSYLLDNEQENYPQLSCDFQEIQEFKDWLKSLKQRIKL